MSRGILVFGVLVSALALGSAPAYAQRSNSGGESSGSAVSRGGDGGGGGGGGGSASTPSAGSSSGSSADWGSPSSIHSSAPAAERQGRRGGSSREGGSSERSGERPRAVPRGGGSESGSTASRPGGSRTAGAAASADDGGDANVAGRTRGGRPQTGTAVDRRVAPGAGGPIRYPVFPSSRYFWPGYGFGLGYFYDPLWYDPYFYGGSYYGGGYYGGGYSGGAPSGGYGSASYAKGPTGSIRLRIDPKDAEVYVDGYYAGLVDDFNGVFQRLTVEAGARQIEIRAPGFEPTRIDVLVKPGDTITYQGTLEARP